MVSDTLSQAEEFKSKIDVIFNKFNHALIVDYEELLSERTNPDPIKAAAVADVCTHSIAPLEDLNATPYDYLEGAFLSNYIFNAARIIMSFISALDERNCLYPFLITDKRLNESIVTVFERLLGSFCASTLDRIVNGRCQVTFQRHTQLSIITLLKCQHILMSWDPSSNIDVYYESFGKRYNEANSALNSIFKSPSGAKRLPAWRKLYTDEILPMKKAPKNEFGIPKLFLFTKTTEPILPAASISRFSDEEESDEIPVNQIPEDSTPFLDD